MVKIITYLFISVWLLFLGNCNNKAAPSATADSTVSTTTNQDTASEPTKEVTTVEATSNDPAKSLPDEITVVFYNVENLFDMEDNPDKKDEEYMPDSDKKWTPDRYQKKLDNLYKVLSTIDEDRPPAIIGVEEVENKQVLEDLVKKTPMVDYDYGIVHYESPDVRGIDVALIYDKGIMKVKDSEKLPVYFDFEPETTTRDILYVKGEIGEEEVHLFVNHWSSRRGGLAASEPKRLEAAKVVRAKLDEIFEADADAKVILGGDFNDEPENKSVAEVLGASDELEGIADNALYNSVKALNDKETGTYNYRGNWNMLDQIILSGAVMNSKTGIRAASEKAGILRQSWMMYKDPKYGERPSRTYGGPNYYGGYSDHLPVYLELAIK